ncbi:MAG: hypothetical protein ACYTHN_12980 [Planctomycetota bacterium]
MRKEAACFSLAMMAILLTSPGCHFTEDTYWSFPATRAVAEASTKGPLLDLKGAEGIGALVFVAGIAGAILAYDLAFGVVSIPHDVVVFIKRRGQRDSYRKRFPFWMKRRLEEKAEIREEKRIH